MQTYTAAQVMTLAERPQGVSISGPAVIRGNLDFPPSIAGPVTLDDVTVAGDVNASSTSFAKLVNLSGTTVEGSVDLSGASFGAAALFDGTTFDGPADLSIAQFSRVSDFRNATFDQSADLESVYFSDIAGFPSARFTSSADFSDAEFHLGADFTNAKFFDTAHFAWTRFSSAATFTLAYFNSQLDFSNSEFDRGATFIAATLNGPADFDDSQSAGNMIFDGAHLNAGGTFVAAVLSGTTSFSQSHVSGSPLDLDEASIAQLDLSGLALQSNNTSVLLPTTSGNLGGLGGLVADPGDVGEFGIKEQGSSAHVEREHALELIQAAAQRGDDTSVANAAHLRLRILKRQDESALLRPLDWVFYWGVGGYFVVWWHPLVTIGALLLIGTGLRLWRKWPVAETVPRQAAYFWKGFGSSFGSLWRLNVHSGTTAEMFEASLYKAVLIVFLMNLANVWPPLHDVLQGILP